MFTYTNPDRENYSITLVREYCRGEFAKVYNYIKNNNGNEKLSNKFARVEIYDKRLHRDLTRWINSQELCVRIFYWLNYNKKLTSEKLRQKIFFCKQGTSIRSIQLLTNAGFPLSSLIDNKKIELSMDGAIEIFMMILKKIKKLHGLGYVNHDLKPSNILVQFGSDINDIKAVNIIDGKYNKINQNLRTGSSVNDYVQSFYSISRKNTTSKFDGTADSFACGLIFMELLAKVLSYNSETNDFLKKRYNLCMDFRKSKLDLDRSKLNRIDNQLKDFLENKLKWQVNKSKNAFARRIFPLIKESLIGNNKNCCDIKSYLQKLEITN